MQPMSAGAVVMIWVIILVVLAGVFIAARSIALWYWKVDQAIEHLSVLNENSRRIVMLLEQRSNSPDAERKKELV